MFVRWKIGRYLLLFLSVVCASLISLMAQEEAFLISKGPAIRGFASTSFDGTNYFTVWSNDGTYRVYGARISKDGIVLDPDGILIADHATLGRGMPSVAFDGENYFVVWASVVGGHIDTIYGTRVSKDGKVLDPYGIQITSSERLGQSNPSVAFNGTNYLVVWEQWGCAQGGIYGARVATDGKVLDENKISISKPDSPLSCLRLPSVTSSNEEFLVAWEAPTLPRFDIRGSRISADGEVLDPSGINISRVPDHNGLSPAVGFDGINYMVVWTDGNNIYATRVAASGSVLDPNGIRIVNRQDGRYFPSLAFDGKNYFVAWADTRNELNEVWGAHLIPTGEILEPNGFQLFSAPSSQAITRHVTFGKTNGLVVWIFNGGDLYGMIITR